MVVARVGGTVVCGREEGGEGYCIGRRWGCCCG
jgi:hypothetical protein